MTKETAYQEGMRWATAQTLRCQTPTLEALWKEVLLIIKNFFSLLLNFQICKDYQECFKKLIIDPVLEFLI